MTANWKEYLDSIHIFLYNLCEDFTHLHVILIKRHYRIKQGILNTIS